MDKAKVIADLYADIERKASLYISMPGIPVMLNYDGTHWNCARSKIVDPDEPLGGPQHVEAWRRAAQKFWPLAIAIVGQVKTAGGGDGVFAVIEFADELGQRCIVWDRMAATLSGRREGRGVEHIAFPRLFASPNVPVVRPPHNDLFRLIMDASDPVAQAQLKILLKLRLEMF